jgi:asparagine synthase (glutamine-hydrolysing)
LPAEVLARPKSGFQVEAGRFVSETLAPWVTLLLSPQRVEQHGLFNADFVRDTLAAPRTRGWRWHWFMLYLMLGAHLWLELFEDGRSVAELNAEAGVRVSA